MKLFIALIFVISTAFASPREEAQAILDSVQNQGDLVTRLELISRRFLSLPYGHGGPLGEGPSGRYDQDPLYRFDTFDCTTYVETVVALALARSVDEFEQEQDRIRYEDGIVDYLKRNHYPSLQWIPNNVDNGLLSEINHLVLPASERRTAEAVINLPGWLKKIKIEEIKVPMATQAEKEFLLEELRGEASNFSPMLARLDYLPIATLLKRPALLNRIPHGTIVNFVRPNWELTDLAGTHMNVSHQGFLFFKDKTLYLRHASTSAPQQVMELPFIDYLARYRNHATMKGVHLMKLN